MNRFPVPPELGFVKPARIDLFIGLAVVGVIVGMLATLAWALLISVRHSAVISNVNSDISYELVTALQIYATESGPCLLPTDFPLVETVFPETRTRKRFHILIRPGTVLTAPPSDRTALILYDIMPPAKWWEPHRSTHLLIGLDRGYGRPINDRELEEELATWLTPPGSITAPPIDAAAFRACVERRYGRPSTSPVVTPTPPAHGSDH